MTLLLIPALAVSFGVLLVWGLLTIAKGERRIVNLDRGPVR